MGLASLFKTLFRILLYLYALANCLTIIRLYIDINS
jgi:hypothetical protein